MRVAWATGLALAVLAGSPALPKNRPGWGTGHRSITVALRVPKQADLSVHTGDGSIRLMGL